MAKSNVGRNVEVSNGTGSIVTLTIDMAQDFGPSKSGKTIIVASTGGSVEIPGHPGVKLGLNIFKAR